MEVTIQNKTGKMVHLNKLVETARSVIGSELDSLPEGDLNIILTDDKEIESLNEDYRHKEGPTDILSFEYGLSEKVIGDIVISLDTIERQAKEFGETFEEELIYILIHGVLHVLGYDHIDDADAEIMDEKHDKYFNQFLGSD